MKAIKEILQTLCNELSRLTSWFIRISQLIINTFVCWLLWLSLTSIYLILVPQELDLNGDNEYLKGYDGNRSHLKWSTTICNTALGSTNQKQKINAKRMNTFIHRPKKSWKFIFIAAVQITLQFDNFFFKILRFEILSLRSLRNPDLFALKLNSNELNGFDDFFYNFLWKYVYVCWHNKGKFLKLAREQKPVKS